MHCKACLDSERFSSHWVADGIMARRTPSKSPDGSPLLAAPDKSYMTCPWRSALGTTILFKRWVEHGIEGTGSDGVQFGQQGYIPRVFFCQRTHNLCVNSTWPKASGCSGFVMICRPSLLTNSLLMSSIPWWKPSGKGCLVCSQSPLTKVISLITTITQQWCLLWVNVAHFWQETRCDTDRGSHGGTWTHGDCRSSFILVGNVKVKPSLIWSTTCKFANVYDSCFFRLKDPSKQ